MSQLQINRSPDLQRLRDEDFDIEVTKSNHLFMKDVPYVNSKREIKRGILVSVLEVAGDETKKPNDHVAGFIGEYPCDKNGVELSKIKNPRQAEKIDETYTINHWFSSKPTHGQGYSDYHDKMTTYAAMISMHAVEIDPTVTARTKPVIVPTETESVFNYLETQSTKAGISMVTAKLEVCKIGIVGVGGTGSYVLDLVAKTPVKEIHIFDGDEFLNHNAFRAPGAPSVDELREKLRKVTYFAKIYSKMHRHVIPHDYFIDAANINDLKDMAFVFLCLDRGKDKRLIVGKLEEWKIPFIDVGMGVERYEDSLLGELRTTTSTNEKRNHVRAKNRISFGDGNPDADYAQNIQIADLNALNAALAVIKWKKLLGFYLDIEKEHNSIYQIDGNKLINEDQL
jgi:hypothetical protein